MNGMFCCWQLPLKILSLASIERRALDELSVDISKFDRRGFKGLDRESFSECVEEAV